MTKKNKINNKSAQVTAASSATAETSGAIKNSGAAKTYSNKPKYYTKLGLSLAYLFLGLSLLWLIFGFFILPSSLKDIVSEQFEKNLNLKIQIEDIKFNPITFELHLKNLSLPYSQEQSFLTIQSLSLSPSFSSIYSFAPVFTSTKIQGLSINIHYLGNGNFAFNPLFATAAQDQKDDAQNHSVFPFACNDFEITGSSIIIQDDSLKVTHTISDLNIFIPFASSFNEHLQKAIKPKLTAKINAVPFSLEGEIFPFTKDLMAHFIIKAKNLELAHFKKYLNEFTRLSLVKGNLDLDLNLNFSQESNLILNSDISGTININNLELEDNKKIKVLELPTATVSLDNFKLFQNKIKFNNVIFNDLYLKLKQEKDGSFDLQNWFLTENKIKTGVGAETEAEAGAGIKTKNGAKVETKSDINKQGYLPPPFLIEGTEVLIRNSKIVLTNLNNNPEGQLEISNINLLVPNFSGQPSASLPFQLSFNLNNQGKVYLQGQAMTYPLSLQAKLKSSGINLSAIQPFLTDLNIKNLQGKLDSQADLSLIQGQKLNLSLKSSRVNLFDLKFDLNPNTKNRLNCKIISLNNLNLDLLKEQLSMDSLNLKAISLVIDKPQYPENIKSTNKEYRLWDIKIKNCTVADLNLKQSDQENNVETLISKADFKLSSLSSSPANQLDFTVNVIGQEEKEKLEAKGKFRLEPLNLALNLNAKNINLNIFSLLPEKLWGIFLKGKIRTKFDLDLEQSKNKEEKTKIKLSGNFNLNNFLLQNVTENKPITTFRQLKLNKISFNSEQQELVIDNLLLDQPRLRLIRLANNMNNLEQLFNRITKKQAEQKTEGIKESKIKTKAKAIIGTETKTEAETKVKAENKNTAPKQAHPEQANPEKNKVAQADYSTFFTTLIINNISVENGTFIFKDESLAVPTSFRLKELNISLDNFSSVKKEAVPFKLSTLLDGVPIQVEGTFTPDTLPPNSCNLELLTKQIDLKKFSPYVQPFIGQGIEQGTLTLFLKFNSKLRDFKADSRILLEKIVLGAKDKNNNAPNYPISFGLALLKNLNGSVQLNIPIDGKLNDPNFKLTNVINQATLGLFGKIIISPFLILSNIASAIDGDENLQFIIFGAGKAHLNRSQFKKLEYIAETLKNQPRLRLILVGMYEKNIDTKGLKSETIFAQIQGMKFKDLSFEEKNTVKPSELKIEPEEYSDLLFEVYKASPLEKEYNLLGKVKRKSPNNLEKELWDLIKITETELKDLALRRAKYVYSKLIELEPALKDRITIAKEIIPNQKDQTGSTRVELKVK